MTETITVTGNLIRCDLRMKPVPSWRCRRVLNQFETDPFDVSLGCVLLAEDGNRIAFRTPPARMHIRRGVRTYRESGWKEAFPDDHPWYVMGDNGFLRPRVQYGDRLTIRGRIKEEGVLFFVKRVNQFDNVAEPAYS